MKTLKSYLLIKTKIKRFERTKFKCKIFLGKGQANSKSYL